ncbi:MAG TPA: SDR family NAD(P)-dependent oxidoreductase [Candidatus Dormibacteraeota bacterium]|nr:SDR family NAD(P)-dependent oxidoreductase [Candidatus Dormibacteraeota bacterium]
MRGRTWLITGASKGLAREWAAAALERGDRVAGAARDVAPFTPLSERFGDRFLPVRLDVSDRAAAVAAVQRVHEHFGGLDVVVNSAGWVLTGMVEEVAERDIREEFDVNCFGALWVTQAALPFLRAAGGGNVVQVSSVGGVMASPGMGAYSASKWALEAWSEALAGEVARFGIRVTLVEPSGYATSSSTLWRTSAPLAGYDPLRAERATAAPVPFGDPAATRSAILAVVDADDPPLRIFLGGGPLERVTQVYAERLATWRAWDDVSVAAAGRPTAPPPAP